MQIDKNFPKIDHYILKQTIGVGGFSRVKLAQHDILDSEVAIKIINKNSFTTSKQRLNMKKEISLLKYLHHPNIIKMYQYFESQDFLYLVMEYAEGGDLMQKMQERKRFSEEKALEYSIQIFSAIEYCHSNLIAHRDLKPENILLDKNGVIKIADFGLSTVLKDGKYIKSPCGSPFFVAPEIISKSQYSGSEADIWSLGAILCTILSGKLPFYGNNLKSLYNKIRSGIFECPQNISANAQCLIKQMLVLDPKKRIKIFEIKNHPWMISNLTNRQLNFSIVLNHLNGCQERKLVEKEILHLICQKKFEFNGLTEDDIQKEVYEEKQNDYVFAYHVLNTDFENKKFYKAISQSSIELILNSYPFEPINQIIVSLKAKAKKYLQIQDSKQEWIYGLQKAVDLQKLIKIIKGALNELETDFIYKTNKFQFKCTKRWILQDICSANNLKSDCDLAFERKCKFFITIFSEKHLFDNKTRYLVNFQRFKGDPMVLLTFVSTISEKIYNILLKENVQLKQVHLEKQFTLLNIHINTV